VSELLHCKGLHKFVVVEFLALHFLRSATRSNG
jgi:hypothetical protein